MTTSPTSAHERFSGLFGGPADTADTADGGSPRRRRNRWIAAGLVVAVVAAFAVIVTRGSGPHYRTATVATRAVAADLPLVGTIEPMTQASVAFPAAGTVASVLVHQGDTVTAGQPLASLDPESLAQTLHTKEAALAQAELTLSKALSGQSVGSVGSSGGAVAQNASAGAGARIVFTNAPVPDPELAAAQQAVLDAQKKVDAAITAADGALANVDSVCAAVTPTPSTTSTTAPGGGDPYAACTQALTDASTAQHALSAAQKTLSSATKALDDLLQKRASTPPTTTPTPPTTRPGGSGSGGGAGSGGSSSGSDGATAPTGGGSGAAASAGGGFSGASSSRSSAPTAADLAAYQKAVDAATAAVQVAQQSVDQATISSPIDGTVVAVNLAPGQSVTAGSTTQNVVVQGAGGFEASVYVGVDSVSRVNVGQPAAVVPDGTHRTLTAKVASIGAAPDPSSTNTTRYVVFLALANPATPLSNGSTGSVSIVTEQAKHALAVPTSAVTTDGKVHTVRVLSGGTPKLRRIKVGTMGSAWTEVRSGLHAGDRVVVADLTEPLPSSATTNTTTGATTVQNGIGGITPGGFPTGGFNGATRRG